MLKSTPIPIKAILAYTKKKPSDVMARLNAVNLGLYSDPADYPAPPIDQATFKFNVDTYSARITAALDRGTKAIAERDQQGVTAIKMLHELGHYVQANCKGDMATFLKSGFEAASQTKAVFQPLSQFIRNIKPGTNSGQLLVMIAAAAGVASYELRWAAIGAGGTLGLWMTLPVTKTRPAISLTGLTPGTAYAFQVP